RGEHQVHAASVDAASQARVLGVGERRERVEGRGGLPDQCVQGIARDARRRRAKRRKASAKVEADDALWGPCGGGRNSNVSTTPKIVALAPIPSARQTTAAATSAGLRANVRRA